jgi:hypothetical protein
MPVNIQLTEMPHETNFAPLGVLGYCLTRSNLLAPVWSQLTLPLKTVDHTPPGKLLDVVVSVLAGCRAIVQVNTRLRPDVALARAWGRDRFAEQSVLSRTLDAFGDAEVSQLWQGLDLLFHREGQVFHHDFAGAWL